MTLNGSVSSFYTLKFAVFACTFGTLWHFLSIKMLHFRQYCVDCLGYTDIKDLFAAMQWALINVTTQLCICTSVCVLFVEKLSLVK